MITTTLRIDEETYTQLTRMAIEDERSINSEILYIIKKYLEQNNQSKISLETIKN